MKSANMLSMTSMSSKSKLYVKGCRMSSRNLATRDEAQAQIGYIQETFLRKYRHIGLADGWSIRQSGYGYDIRNDIEFYWISQILKSKNNDLTVYQYMVFSKFKIIEDTRIISIIESGFVHHKLKLRQLIKTVQDSTLKIAFGGVLIL